MGEKISSLDALSYALATWVYVLHASGTAPSDAEVLEHCKAIGAASNADQGNAAGEALVATLKSRLSGEGPEDVAVLVESLFGSASRALGEGSREERTHRIRSYQFSKNLPWLARIYERQDDGVVAPSWLVVERVTDEVTAMDPNPWNDIDEERHVPVADFHVLWELDGCSSVSLA